MEALRVEADEIAALVDHDVGNVNLAIPDASGDLKSIARTAPAAAVDITNVCLSFLRSVALFV